MKKLMYVAVLGMAMGLTSCGEDDVKDLACDTARGPLKDTVQLAIDAYNDNKNEITCEAAKTAIETYKSNECGDDSFDTVLASLSECSGTDSN